MRRERASLARGGARRRLLAGLVSTVLVATFVQASTSPGASADGLIDASLDVNLLEKPFEEVVDVDLDLEDVSVAEVDLGLDPVDLDVRLFDYDLQEAALVPLEPGTSLLGSGEVLDTVANPLCGATTVLGFDPFCLLGSLDFQFVTRWEGGLKPIQRSHIALVNTPTFLDVDADILPDLVATLEVVALDQFRLTINRLAGETQTLPLRIEAIVKDPTQALPRDYLNFGYDARASRAPDTWQSVIALPEGEDPSDTVVNISTTIGGPGASLKTLGGLFDGTAANRLDPMSGVLGFAPVPDQIGLGFTLGSYLEVRAGATSSTTLTGDVALVDGDDSQHVHLNLTELPERLRLRYTERGEAQRLVEYCASDVVPSLEAEYTRVESGRTATKVIANATDLSTEMTLQQLSATSGTFAADIPLGSIEVGYANGEPKRITGDHPYARVFDDGTLQSYAGRIDGLKTASISVGEKIAAEIRLDAASNRKFRALADLPGGFHVDGNVSNIPAHLLLGYDPAAGLLDYNAFGETIQAISVDATRTEPFFERVTKIHGEISELPSDATLDLRPDGQGVKLLTNNPIGLAEVMVTSGEPLELADGEYGARVEDVPERFAAAARVKGLTVLDVGLESVGPNAADTKIVANAQLEPTPLVIGYTSQEESDGSDLRTIDVMLSTIPSEVAVQVDPIVGTYTYDANGPIDEVTLDVRQTPSKPIVDRADHLHAVLRGLPANITLSYLSNPADRRPGAGTSVQYATSAKLGELEAALTSGPEVRLGDGEFGALIEDVRDHFAVFTRVSGLKLVDLLLENAGTKVTAHVQLDPNPLVIRHVASGRQTEVFLNEIPRDVSVEVDTTAGTYVYEANEGIDLVQLNIVQPESNPIVSTATRLQATLRGVPADLTLKFLPDAVEGKGRAGITSALFAASAGIDEVEALVTSESEPDASLPEGEYGAILEDTTGRRGPGGHYTAFVRVKELKLVELTVTPSADGDRLFARVQIDPTPLTLRYVTHTMVLDGELSSVPDDVALDYNPTPGTITYSASAPIDSVRAEVEFAEPLFGNARHLDARIEDVPAWFIVNLKPEVETRTQTVWGTGIKYLGSDPVTEINVSVDDGRTEAHHIDPGLSGLNMRSVPGQFVDEFAARARLRNVEAMTFASYGNYWAASLHTVPEENGDLQDLTLNLYSDSRDDAVNQVGHLQIELEDLPTSLELTGTGRTTEYRASSRVPRLTISGTNLPGGVAGGSMEGGLHFLEAELTDIPQSFEVTTEQDNGTAGETVGLSTDDASGIATVVVDAWDVEPRPVLETVPTNATNGVSVNVRDGRFALGGRLYGVRGLSITLDAGADDGFEVSPRFKDEGTFTLRLTGGTTESGLTDDGPLDLGVQIGNMPTSSQLGFRSVRGVRLDWRALDSPPTPSTFAAINLSSKNVGIRNMNVVLPAEWHGCLGSTGDCEPKSIQVVPEFGTEVPNDFVLVSETDSLVRIRNGRVCLRETDEDGNTIVRPSADVYDRCQGGSLSPSRNYIDLDDVVFGTLRFEFMMAVHVYGTVFCESESGAHYLFTTWFFQSVEQCREHEGERIRVDGDYLKLHLESDPNGLSAGSVRIRNLDTEKETRLRVRTDDPLIPRDFENGDYFTGVIDLSGGDTGLFPSKVFQHGRLWCGGTTIDATVPVVGLAEVLPGVLNDNVPLCV